MPDDMVEAHINGVCNALAGIADHVWTIEELVSPLDSN